MRTIRLRESTRDLLIEATFEAGRYFGVLILGITIDDEKIQQPLIVVDVECERGEKSGSFAFFDNKVGIETAISLIRAIVGDWTK